MATLETPAGPATLKRSERRTLAISVLPDGSLELIAPNDSSEQDILAKVVKRSRWIARQRSVFREMNTDPMPRRYVSGATHRYLGRQYRLNVVSGEAASVRLKGGYFHVTTPTRDTESVEEAMNSWFEMRAKKQFSKRIEFWFPWCRKHRLPEPVLRIRRMRKRWGSADKKGTITLNPELIHIPSPCIAYVIAHEICHLKHTDHGPAFFRLLSSVLPGWKELKIRLERSELT